MCYRDPTAHGPVTRLICDGIWEFPAYVRTRSVSISAADWGLADGWQSRPVRKSRPNCQKGSVSFFFENYTDFGVETRILHGADGPNSDSHRETLSSHVFMRQGAFVDSVLYSMNDRLTLHSDKEAGRQDLPLKRS